MNRRRSRIDSEGSSFTLSRETRRQGFILIHLQAYILYGTGIFNPIEIGDGDG
jgi:hypothetical protein